MATTTKTATQKSTSLAMKKGAFFGELYAFNNSLKLYHWHVTGKGSYAEHIALDQALESVNDALDRIVETSYAMYGDVDVVIPSASAPKDIVKHCEGFYKYLDQQRDLFKENFTQAIIDDYQEAVQQLLYRLKRLQ